MEDRGQAAGSVWFCGEKGGAGMSEVCVCLEEEHPNTDTAHSGKTLPASTSQLRETT